MANPNKTAGKAIRRIRKNAPRFKKTERAPDAFCQWLIEQAQAGRTFKNLEEARAEFEGRD